MDLETDAALLLLEHIRGDVLVDVACDALQAGIDCQALRELAALSNPSRSEAFELLSQALRQLDKEIPEGDAIGKIATIYYCSLIVEGKEIPAQGAWELYLLNEQLKEPAYLRKMNHLAFISDFAWNLRDENDRKLEVSRSDGEIRSEAHRLIALLRKPEDPN